MADWANPTVTSQYDVFVQEAKDRDIDSCTMFVSAPTNPPNGAIRFNRSTNIFEQYSTGSSTWSVIPLAIAGGGTGSTSAATARVNLGLGTMAQQNANAVAIVSGTIVGLTQFETNCSIAFANDAAYDIGSFAQQARKGYFRSGLVLPVGTDKFVTS